jgi:hypothetical protein
LHAGSGVGASGSSSVGLSASGCTYIVDYDCGGDRDISGIENSASISISIGGSSTRYVAFTGHFRGVLFMVFIVVLSSVGVVVLLFLHVGLFGGLGVSGLFFD